MSPASEADLKYDLVIIGSGQAGNPLAAAFHAAGKRVAMIERAAVGGTCVNYGCTPTKTMIASAEVAALARRADEYGVHLNDLRVEMREVVARKDRIVRSSREGSEKKYNSDIDLYRGTGSFLSRNSIRVALNDGGERTLHAATVVIDTGLTPVVPKIEGIEGVPHLDNVSVMQLQVVPEHLLVLGGGYIGLEFAQMFRRFGAKVTIVQHGGQLLENEDADVAEAMAEILREDGIQIHLGTRAVKAERAGESIELSVEGAGESRTVTGSHLLIATGRKPNTSALNLEAAGVAIDEQGFIVVNERLETSTPGIYAAGDVKGGPAFTHIAYDDYRILKANLLTGGSRVVTGRLIPYCVYTDPQLGRIGLSEADAKKAGTPYKVARVKMSSVARAYETGQERGFMKALVEPETKQILGAAILGADGGELMSMLEIAMMGKLPYTALRDGIFAHPTFAESLNTLFMSLDE